MSEAVFLTDTGAGCRQSESGGLMVLSLLVAMIVRDPDEQVGRE